MITHIISTLGIGGAEKQLLAFCKESRVQNRIIVLTKNDNVLHGDFDNLDIEIIYLDFQTKPVLSLLKLNYLVLKSRQKIISWLYHSSFLILPSSLIKKNIFWYFHHAYPTEATLKPSTKRIIKVLGQFSTFAPKKILFCSKVGLDNHVEIGFDRKNCLLIHNGYKLDKTKYRTLELINYLRANQKISLGMIARYHPVKDHDILLEAVSKTKGIQLVLIGYNLTRNNKELLSKIEKLNLTDRTTLLGPRTDINKILANLDASILTSKFEAFPNVMVESILVGTPFYCFAIGDVSLHLPEKYIIPSRTLDHLVIKIKSITHDTRVDVNLIKEFSNQFSIDKMVSSIENL